MSYRLSPGPGDRYRDKKDSEGRTIEVVDVTMLYIKFVRTDNMRKGRVLRSNFTTESWERVEE